MKRTEPSNAWIKAATKSFNHWRNNLESYPHLHQLHVLWLEGYTARNAGKLMAFLASSDERGFSTFSSFFITNKTSR